MRNDELDRAIRRLVQAEIDGLEVPQEARERVRKALGLEKEQKAPWFYRKVAVALTCALAALVLSAYLVFPSQAKAIGQVVLSRIGYIVKDALRNISQGYGRNGDQALSSPQDPENSRTVFSTLEEARNRLPFTLLVPKYLPKDANLTQILLSGQEPLMTVRLIYSGEKGRLVLTESGPTDNAGSGIAYDADDTGVKTVDINGVNGTLLANKNGQVLLSWYKNSVAYQIAGTYPEEEILRVARSLAKPGT